MSTSLHPSTSNFDGQLRGFRAAALIKSCLAGAGYTDNLEFLNVEAQKFAPS
jgi:hypothetical protein